MIRDLFFDGIFFLGNILGVWDGGSCVCGVNVIGKWERVDFTGNWRRRHPHPFPYTSSPESFSEYE